MSETQERPIDDQEIDPTRAKQVAWVKAKLDIDVPTRPRSGAVMGGHRAPPPPPKPTGPIIGQQRTPENQETAFNKRLGIALDQLEAMRTMPSASDKADTAKVALEKALGDMSNAAKAKDFATANTQLTAAEDAAKIVSDERVAAKGKFEAAFYPLSTKLDNSLAVTKGIAGVDAKVLTAEKTATDLRNAAEKAADDYEYKTALAGLPPLDNAIKALDAEYLAAANATEAAVNKALGELTDQVKHVEDVQLDSTKTKASLTELTKQATTATGAGTSEAVMVAMLAVKTEIDQAVAAAKDMVKSKANTGAAAGSTELRDKAADAIKGLATGDPKKALQARLTEWDKQKLAADKEPDLGKQKTALAKLDTDAQKLLDDALKAGGGDVDAKKQAAFKAALEKRFGLIITVPPGMTNTHFDKMYEMFAKLPIEHTGTDKMKKLTYNTEEGAAYGGGEIFMGDYGDAKGDWDYKEPQNGFNISTLHEIGHSVDDKYGLMAGNTSAGCGGWKGEDLASVKKVFVDSYNGAPFPDLDAMVETALTKGAVELINPTDGSKYKVVEKFTDADRPGGLSNQDWQKVLAIVNNCVKIRTDNWPWGKNNTVRIGTRVYQEAYDGDWVSYLAASRDKAKEVRDYQWRAPGEWFAELYAWSWMKKEVAPSGIDKKVADYMWTPGS